jgi:hypothetical protein
MTTEQIQAIRSAEAELRAFDKHQELERNAYHETLWKEKLQPLTKDCDHTYPWGDSAVVSDFSSSDTMGRCYICHKGVR